MYVIVVYDVQSKINPKVLKLFKQYLFHVQNSVFEGNISEGMLNCLKNQLRMFDCDDNQFIFYQVPSENVIHKDTMGQMAKKTRLMS